MTVAVDLGSGAVKIADGADASVLLADPIDPELVARVGTTVPLVRRDGARVLTQSPHDAYVRAVAAALDGVAAESAAILAPDWWSKRAHELAEQSFAAHASGPFRLVSPAVAAVSASRDRRRLPSTVAVLDIGAEISSTTVLTEVDGVHRVVGRPAVLHGWAGNAIDRLLLHHVLGWLDADGHQYEPSDAENASAGLALLSQVKAAKERLSTRPAATLIPELTGASSELRLVRSEFDEVARGTVDAIVAMLKAGIATNAPDGAGAVLLIGGSVSIPLVTQVISVEVGVPVILDDDPATLAVRGAATVEMPPPPRQRWWRRRRAAAARNVFDLNNAPEPDSEPYLAPLSESEPEPEPPVDEPAAEVSDGRLGSFIEESRREAAAQPEPESEPVHVVVGTPDAPRSKRAPRWASSPEDSEWSGARRTWVDEDGRFQLRVNDRDFDVDMGTELASTSVTLLLIGRHVFVTLSENGELLRELLLNPDHDYRPE